MMTRNQFLRSLVQLGAGAAGLAVLAGCTKDDDVTPPLPDAGGNPLVDASTGTTNDAAIDGGMQPPTCGSASATIGTNHGHAIVVPAADVNTGDEKTYQIQGTSAHPHTVVITAAQFATLRTSGSVSVMSTQDAGHRHAVTVTCAAA